MEIINLDGSTCTSGLSEAGHGHNATIGKSRRCRIPTPIHHILRLDILAGYWIEDRSPVFARERVVRGSTDDQRSPVEQSGRTAAKDVVSKILDADAALIGAHWIPHCRAIAF